MAPGSGAEPRHRPRFIDSKGISITAQVFIRNLRNGDAVVRSPPRPARARPASHQGLYGC